MIDNSPSFKNAHPRAQQLMDEDFYYSPIEESGPFGSDDGADTFAGFQQWRSAFPKENPLVYLTQQLSDWGYPPIDLQQADAIIIQERMQQEQWEIHHIVGMDAVIIALAFGQLYLEGSVDTKLIQLALLSLNRQLRPEFIQLWDDHYQPTREEQMGKLKSVLHRVM